MPDTPKRRRSWQELLALASQPLESEAAPSSLDAPPARSTWAMDAPPPVASPVAPAPIPAPVVRPTTGIRTPAGSFVNDVQQIAKEIGARVTSTTGGRHNPGSKHYRGDAVDIGMARETPEQQEQIRRQLEARGLRVVDERRRPAGQKEWGGAHLHVERGKYESPEEWLKRKRAQQPQPQNPFTLTGKMPFERLAEASSPAPSSVKAPIQPQRRDTHAPAKPAQAPTVPISPRREAQTNPFAMTGKTPFERLAETPSRVPASQEVTIRQPDGTVARPTSPLERGLIDRAARAALNISPVGIAVNALGGNYPDVIEKGATELGSQAADIWSRDSNWSQMPAEAAKTFRKGVRSLPQGLASLADTVGMAASPTGALQLLGYKDTEKSPPLAEAVRPWTQQQMAETDRLYQDQYGIDPQAKPTISSILGSGVGSSALLAGGGAILGGAKGVMAMGAAMNAQQSYEEARQKGATPQEAMRAAAIAAPIGALEGAFGAEAQLAKMGVSGVMARKAAEVLKSFPAEAGQEVLTEILNNINKIYVSGYAPDEKVLDGVVEAVIGSLGVTGAMGGASLAAQATPRARGERSAQRYTQQLANLEAPITNDPLANVTPEQVAAYEAQLANAANEAPPVKPTTPTTQAQPVTPPASPALSDESTSFLDALGQAAANAGIRVGKEQTAKAPKLTPEEKVGQEVAKWGGDFNTAVAANDTVNAEFAQKNYLSALTKQARLTPLAQRTPILAEIERVKSYKTPTPQRPALTPTTPTAPPTTAAPPVSAAPQPSPVVQSGNEQRQVSLADELAAFDAAQQERNARQQNRSALNPVRPSEQNLGERGNQQQPLRQQDAARTPRPSLARNAAPIARQGFDNINLDEGFSRQTGAVDVRPPQTTPVPAASRIAEPPAARPQSAQPATGSGGQVATGQDRTAPIPQGRPQTQAPVTPQGVAKEPWQMTRVEAEKQFIDQRFEKDKKIRPNPTSAHYSPYELGGAVSSWRNAIGEALRQGKVGLEDIAPDVLRDAEDAGLFKVYPDLQQKQDEETAKTDTPPSRTRTQEIYDLDEHPAFADIDRRVAARGEKGTMGQFHRYGMQKLSGDTALLEHPELREILNLPPMPARPQEGESWTAYSEAAAHTADALAEVAGAARSSQMDAKGLDKVREFLIQTGASRELIEVYEATRILSDGTMEAARQLLDDPALAPVLEAVRAEFAKSGKIAARGRAANGLRETLTKIAGEINAKAGTELISKSAITDFVQNWTGGRLESDPRGWLAQQYLARQGAANTQEARPPQSQTPTTSPDSRTDDTQQPRPVSEPAPAQQGGESGIGSPSLVNADGSPKVLYHGTSNASFTEFDIHKSRHGLFGMGIYLTEDPEMAQTYTKKGRGAVPGVVRATANLTRWMDMDAPVDLQFWQSIPEFTEGQYEGQRLRTNEDAYRVLEDYYKDNYYSQAEGQYAILETLESRGLEGLTHIGGGRVRSEGKKHRVWIALDPSLVQIAQNAPPQSPTTTPDTQQPRPVSEPAPAQQGGESGVVPASVRKRVEFAVQQVQQAAAELERGRALDKRFSGAGRYESETFEKISINSSLETIKEFRKFAPQNGVDAEAVLREMGGVPDVSLSSEGKAWQEDQKTRNNKENAKTQPQEKNDTVAARLASERDEIANSLMRKEVRDQLLAALERKRVAIENAKGRRFVAYKAEEGALGWRIADAETGQGEIQSLPMGIAHPTLGETIADGAIRFRTKSQAEDAATKLEAATKPVPKSQQGDLNLNALDRLEPDTQYRIEMIRPAQRAGYTDDVTEPYSPNGTFPGSGVRAEVARQITSIQWRYTNTSDARPVTIRVRKMGETTPVWEETVFAPPTTTPDTAPLRKPEPENPEPELDFPVLDNPPDAGPKPEAEKESAEGDAEFYVDPDDIDFQRARDAYNWNSMSPERRARQEQEQYVASVTNLHNQLMAIAKTDAQKEVVKQQVERYKKGYVQKNNAVLAAKSRTANPMVTGPARFPTERNRKALDTERRRVEEFLEWEKKAKSAATEAVLAARTSEAVIDDEWALLRKRTLSTIATIQAIDNGTERGASRALFVNNLAKRIETLAKNGNQELVRRTFDLIRSVQEKMAKPIFTPKHKVWSLEKASADNTQEPALTGESVIAEYDGATIVNNYDAERVQIRFTGIPSPEVRAKLKSAAWRWSPSNSAWQRQNTNAAISSAKSILDATLKPKDFDFTTSFLGTGAFANFNDTDIRTIAKHFVAHTKSFVEWAKAMVKSFGESIRPRLRQMWQGLQTFYKDERGILDETAIVESIKNLARKAGFESNADYAARKRAEMENSPEFKRWFGDSVVTVDGKPGSKPLIVYRGDDFASDVMRPSRNGEGIDFTPNPEYAETYGNIRAFYLQAEKLFDTGSGDFQEIIAAANKLARQIESAFLAKKGEYPTWQFDFAADAEELYERNLRQSHVKNATSRTLADLGLKYGGQKVGAVMRFAGYDGLFKSDESRTDVAYTVFSPTQIKSAFNRGTFDPLDPNISNFGIPFNAFAGTGKALSKGIKKLITTKVNADFNPAEWVSEVMERVPHKFNKAAGFQLNEQQQKAFQRDFQTVLEAFQRGDYATANQAKARIDKQLRDSFLETVTAIRKVNLVGQATTHARNLGSNAVSLAIDEIAQVPKVFADIAMAYATGRPRTAALSTAFLNKLVAKESLSHGWEHFKKALTEGMTDVEAEQMQVVRRHRSGNALLDAYINKQFDLLNAEDRMFYNFAYHRSLWERAKVHAINEKKTGRQAIQQRAREIYQNPTDEMAQAAGFDADIVIFKRYELTKEKAWLTERIQGFRRTESQLGKFAVENIIPFDRTPTNIITRLVEASPLGFGKAARELVQLRRQVKEGVDTALTAEQQRQFTQTIGRATAGTVLFTLGAVLYNAGLLTGAFGANDEDKDKPAGSLKVGNKWVSLEGWGPQAGALLLGATTVAAWRGENDSEESLAKVGLEVARSTFGELPLLEGTTRLAEDFQRKGGMTVAGQMARQFTPILGHGTMNNIATQMDTFTRKPKGFVQAFAEGLPVVRESLPDNRRRMASPFDPFRTQESRTQPLNKEVRDELRRRQVPFEPPRRKEAANKTREEISSWEARQQRATQMFNTSAQRMIDSTAYQKAAPETQTKMLESLKRRVLDFETGAANQKDVDTDRLDPYEILRSVEASAERSRTSRERRRERMISAVPEIP